MYGQGFSRDTSDLCLNPYDLPNCIHADLREPCKAIAAHISSPATSSCKAPQHNSRICIWAIQGNAAHIPRPATSPCKAPQHASWCLQLGHARPRSTHSRHRGLQTFTSQAVIIWSKHVPEMGHTGRPVTVSMILSVQLGPHTWAQPHCLHMCTSCIAAARAQGIPGGCAHSGATSAGCRQRHMQQYHVAAWKPQRGGDSKNGSRTCAAPTESPRTHDGWGRPGPVGSKVSRGWV